MRVIIYQTGAGTSRRYAELLSEKTGLPCAPLSEADFPADSEVIFISWVMSDALQGLAQVRARYETLLVVGAVRLFSLASPKAEVEEKLNVGAPLVLLPGAFDPRKVSGMVRMVLGMVKRALKSKSTGSAGEQKALDFLENGADLFDEAALDPLIGFLNGEPLPEADPDPETNEEATD